MFRDPVLTDPTAASGSHPVRIGLISTYPPTHCGLATFSAALVRQFRHAGHHVAVVCLDDGKNDATVGGVVVARHVNGAPGAVQHTAEALRDCDVVVVQHEFGIFGGADGDEVLAIMDALDVPVVVVAHTVPLHPTAHQAEVLTAVCHRAAQVVVMTDTARERLIGGYPVDADSTITIPHGAASPTPVPTDARAQTHTRRPQLLTWGLLGPGKGIEHVIAALALLDRRGVAPHYTVAGITHPNVLRTQGDHYRMGLIEQVRNAGLEGRVTFDATYRDVPELTRFVASAWAVVLPYDSRDQVTSGVLVDAIATGRPVIATAFPHALELLGSGAGIVVPHGDVEGLAAAIDRMFSRPTVRAEMAAEAARLAPDLLWPNVARRYLDLFEHVRRLTPSVAR